MTNVFGFLPDDTLRKLLPYFSEICTKPGEVIISENDASDKLYVIGQGKADVVKLTEHGEREYVITQLGPGDTAGEMAIIDTSLRTATVRTATNAQLLVISTKDLHEQSIRDPELARVYISLAQELGQKLKQANQLCVNALEQELNQQKTRIAMGYFLGLVIIALTTYSFLLISSAQLVKMLPTGSLVSLGITAMFTLVFIGIIKTSNLTLYDFGFNLNQWRQSLKEGIIYTVPVLILLLLAKWILISMVPRFANEPLFNFTAAVKTAGELPFNSVCYIALVAGLYFVSVVMQEILCRGGLQSPMHKFFNGSKSTRNAILFSNLIFTMSHLHMSVMFAFMAFLPGLFWGWLYSRTRSLLSPIISHALVGFWALFVLGIQQVTKMT